LLTRAITGAIAMSQSKPFFCPHAGCDKTFANEDHLSVHQLKHDLPPLHLDFASSGDSSVVLPFTDQTPTPTKFFRVEEGCLFEEISATGSPANPFDFQFRKATSSVQIAEDTEGEGQKPANGEFVFASALGATEEIITLCPASDGSSGEEPIGSGKMGELKTHRTAATRSHSETASRVAPAKIVGSRASRGKSTSIKTRRSTNASVEFFDAPKDFKNERNNVSLSVRVEDSEKSLSRSLKTNFYDNQSDRKNVEKTKSIVFPSSKKGNSRNGGTRSKTFSLLKKDDAFVDSDVRQDGDDDVRDEDDNEKSDYNIFKRQKLLAQNRDSSWRSRQKRKSRVQNLESDCEDLRLKNESLQMELNAARKELVSVKELLREHVSAGCHVALRQEMEGRLTDRCRGSSSGSDDGFLAMNGASLSTNGLFARARSRSSSSGNDVMAVDNVDVISASNEQIVMTTGQTIDLTASNELCVMLNEPTPISQCSEVMTGDSDDRSPSVTLFYVPDEFVFQS